MTIISIIISIVVASSLMTWVTDVLYYDLDLYDDDNKVLSR
jgi:hypothetical protein